DEENQAFEKDDSPFGSREEEVLSAITTANAVRVDRSSDLMPFLRRPDRNCRRLLGKLERWFLRVYDIRHSSAIINHHAGFDTKHSSDDRNLSWHTPKIHATVLLTMLAPFVGAVFAYDRAPWFFDLLCAGEVVFVYGATVWFLLYRFCWKRDLSFFHASVPRIGAGIIVGYLPVFLIDEVWDLASREQVALNAVVLLIGLVTLLYIYVEVARRIPNTSVAFARARSIFLLGVVEAFGVGVVMTSLVGPFMVARNWSPQAGELSVAALRDSMPPMIGQLPHVVGFEGVWVFPSALLLMTFLSFFIGIFLQLTGRGRRLRIRPKDCGRSTRTRSREMKRRAKRRSHGVPAPTRAHHRQRAGGLHSRHLHGTRRARAFDARGSELWRPADDHD
ncbi:MAG: hypothetical protein ACKVIW_13440, partial [bacterium]